MTTKEMMEKTTENMANPCFVANNGVWGCSPRRWG